MRRFFWNGMEDGGIVTLKGTEARHMREVLRMRAGCEVVLCDGSGNDYYAVTEQIGDDFVELKLGERLSKNSEPQLNVTLYLAHTKGERIEYAVQKSVEIGAYHIKLFDSSRCVAKGSANKLERLNRIAMEAAKQSGRSRLVGVEDAGSFNKVIKETQGTRYFCYEMETVPIREKLSGLTNNVSVMCGPEGGFTQEEAELAQKNGWKSVLLGKRILRAETAPLVALTVLLYEHSDI